MTWDAVGNVLLCLLGVAAAVSALAVVIATIAAWRRGEFKRNDRSNHN